MDPAATPIAAADGRAQANQFALLGQRRFAPFFWTQFLGAGNDNLFKFGLTVLVTYQVQVAWLPASLAGLVIGALFILPFVLFSATSGQLADKLDKARLMRVVKSMEIVIMAIAGVGFLTEQVPLLLGCIFLMGLHSTLFGPVKFAYLPQHLTERELTGGNGMVEMGTFVAILLGSVAGGVLVASPGIGSHPVALACLGLAIVGRATAQAIPASPPSDPGLRINWNPFTETWRNLRLAHAHPVVFRSLLGISWMWFFGAVFLAQFPSLAKDVLHGDEQVASFLLVVFSIGIGIGSLLCEVLSRRHVEIGLVPLGAIGMSVFAIDFYAATAGLPPSAQQTLAQFLGRPEHLRVVADLALLALSAGLYSVPMYALIQLRSPPAHRARIIAANNILNALFMVASALIAGALLAAGLTIPQVFGVVGALNAVVSLYVFLRVPEYLLRFVAFVVARACRLRVTGDENLPRAGAALVVARGGDRVAALLLTAASARSIRFIVDRRPAAPPWLAAFHRLSRTIAVTASGPGATFDGPGLQAALDALDAGELVGICLDEARAPDGAGGGPGDDAAAGPSARFGPVAAAILARRDVPVVPVVLQNLRPHRSGPVRLVVGPAWAGEAAAPATPR